MKTSNVFRAVDWNLDDSDDDAVEFAVDFAAEFAAEFAVEFAAIAAAAVDVAVPVDAYAVGISADELADQYRTVKGLQETRESPVEQQTRINLDLKGTMVDLRAEHQDAVQQSAMISWLL